MCCSSVNFSHKSDSHRQTRLPTLSTTTGSANFCLCATLSLKCSFSVKSSCLSKAVQRVCVLALDETGVQLLLLLHAGFCALPFFLAAITGVFVCFCRLFAYGGLPKGACFNPHFCLQSPHHFFSVPNHPLPPPRFIVQLFHGHFVILATTPSFEVLSTCLCCIFSYNFLFRNSLLFLSLPSMLWCLTVFALFFSIILPILALLISRAVFSCIHWLILWSHWNPCYFCTVLIEIFIDCGCCSYWYGNSYKSGDVLVLLSADKVPRDRYTKLCRS